MKYLVVSGGVVSGLGKGITASSIGVLLRGFGLKVTCIKIDPYLNCDAGNMSPFEHGEVYVLDDGGEVDLDMGNYERFLDVSFTRDHNITTGKIYKSVLDKERQGCYLGKTVQVIPHITNEIVDWIVTVAHVPLEFSRGATEVADICIIELGGTVGDMESAPFVEGLRQLECRAGPKNFACVHVGLVPCVTKGTEQKSKPTQHSIGVLRSLGLMPSIVACRCSEAVSLDVRTKIAQCASLSPARVVSIPDVKDGNLWAVPLTLEAQNVHLLLCEIFDICAAAPFSIEPWKRIADRWDGLMSISYYSKIVTIAIVGKYTNNKDAYLSVTKGLQHACMAEGLRLQVKWIESTSLEGGDGCNLRGVDGVLVPGGFGHRGIEGMIEACKLCRVNGIPYFGICLGMQVAVIEYCRNVLGITDAHSQEFADQQTGSTTQVIASIDGAMRLGLYGTTLSPTSLAYDMYKNNIVYERHRHRYVVDPTMIPRLEDAGLTISGKDSSTGTVEIVELPDHPFYVGCQFHPEYRSRPLKPSPLFLGFIRACRVALRLPSI